MFSLAHLTVIHLTPDQMIEMAADIGYDAVGLRLIKVTDNSPGYPLMEDKRMMRATQAALANTGIGVHDIEFVRMTPNFDIKDLEPFLEAGAQLGANQIITAPYDPNLSRLADSLAHLGEKASSYDLNVVLEFFPWTNVPDLATAYAVTKDAGDSVGILVDTLHFDRSNSSLQQLATIPVHKLPFMHLCDALRLEHYEHEALLHTAREDRLPPGQGQIPLQAILDAMPKGVPMGLEVPMQMENPYSLAEMRACALQCLNGAQALVNPTAAHV
ncbi:sugar phosphate isomerase/epimerase family protein [Vibrio furnissii]|uniref:sugar phosphate isomerase/epimerase family protein n=1 Tax=Vibrio furnissii TaxID=29494 RepID=UPI001E3A38E9|nr:sugar phosphate isomerase/epimerase [Vibrio furnissii]UHJ61261.1 sugar phosphate isomerase/epimerase [Vibrio furnissii]